MQTNSLRDKKTLTNTKTATRFLAPPFPVHPPGCRLLIFRSAGACRLREHEIEIRTLLKSQITALE